MLVVDPRDPGRFEFEADSDDDFFMTVKEIIDGMCPYQVKGKQSLLPRGAPDYEHPVTLVRDAVVFAGLQSCNMLWE